MQNTQKHNDLIEKVRLILQTMVFEEIISKHSFDAIQSIFKQVSENYPTHNDFFRDLLKQGVKIPLTATERTTTNAFNQDKIVLDGAMIDGVRYNITLKRKD